MITHIDDQSKGKPTLGFISDIFPGPGGRKCEKFKFKQAISIWHVHCNINNRLNLVPTLHEILIVQQIKSLKLMTIN